MSFELCELLHITIRVDGHWNFSNNISLIQFFYTDTLFILFFYHINVSLKLWYNILISAIDTYIDIILKNGLFQEPLWKIKMRERNPRRSNNKRHENNGLD